MAHYRHYDDRGYDESEPLDNNYPLSPTHGNTYYDQDPYQQQQSYQPHAPHGYQYEHSLPQQFSGGHPESAFNRLRAERQQSRGRHDAAAGGAVAGAVGGYAAADHAPPPPPPHYGNHNWGVTPGADNFGNQASGGMAGIAYNVADQNARESGIEAARGMSPPSSGQHTPHQAPSPPQQAYYTQSPRPSAHALDRESNSSLTPLGSSAVPPGMGTPSRTPLGYAAHDPYNDDPYQSFSTSRNNEPHLGVVNPHDIADDGDDGLGYRRPQRTSMLSFSNSDRNSSVNGAKGMGGAAVGVTAAGLGAGAAGRGGGMNGGGYNPALEAEKPSEWISNNKSKKKKWKWCAIFTLIFVVIGAIVGGTLGGTLGRSMGSDDSDSDSSRSGSGQSADDDHEENGDLNINSDEIRQLMNNDNLHKVFPGFDYTPLNVQHPYCIHDPPSQNNITRDVAVLSQLTNVIRLYGTDCNQTQMVLHSIKQLELEDDMTVWLGVWQDDNSTTNARQLEQLWDILDEYGEEPFAGLIVANEVLFREEFTHSELSTLLDDVRSNLTSKGIDLPVSSSDLGDDIDTQLADSIDYIMSNIHPFFAGVPASEAASWTWSFWENHNQQYWKNETERNIIAEIGWPSDGGTACGDGSTSCSQGAVANVSGINQLLEDWVCQALENGTNYFWFSAFDEPWKAQFDEEGKEWESKWGLMDVNRNLKDGVVIPDCDGQTI